MLASSIIKAITQIGLPISTLSELASDMGPTVLAMLNEIEPGILVHRSESDMEDSLGAFASRYGFSYTLESGMWNGLKNRADMLVKGVQSAIATFSKIS
jgi:hypothetical protein